MWQPRGGTPFGQLLLAYPDCVVYWGQTFLKYGPAWRPADAVLGGGGFACVVGTNGLRRADIATPGLVVEDLNMTFEVHKQRLGRIAYLPNAAVAYTQDPAVLSDYVRQVKRWALALWQGVRRQGLAHKGFFWVTLSVCVMELALQSLVLLCSLILLLASLVFGLAGQESNLVGGNGIGAWLLGIYRPALLLGVV